MVYLTYKDWTMSDVSVRDCVTVAASLRCDDLREIRAVSGRKSAYAAVAESVQRSQHVYSIRRNGRCMMVFGVAPRALLSEEYFCWALSSEDIADAGSGFLRHCRHVMDVLNDRYPAMMNYVGVWNRCSLRWLRWCGFEILPAVRLGIHGEMMHPVIRRRKECVR